jgi:hypothetical protein
MQYRAYVFGSAGQTLERIAFEAPDDAAAMEHARQYVLKQSVEVWQDNRRVGELTPL